MAGVLGFFGSFGMVWGAWGATVPAIQTQTGISDRDLGLVLLLIAAGALPSMRAAPWLLSRWPRATLPVLSVLLGVAFAVAATATGGGRLGVSLLGVGLMSGAHDVTMNAIASSVEQRRGRPVLQLAHATFSLAVVVTALAVGGARQVGASAAASLFGVAGVVTIGTLGTVLAGGARDVGHHAPTPVAVTAATGSRARLYVVVGGAVLLASLVENALQNWSAIHLERSFNAPPLYGGMAAATFALGAVGGRLLAHQFATKQPLARVLAVTGLSSSLAIGGAGITDSPQIALVAIGIAGAAVSTVLPAGLSEAGRYLDNTKRNQTISRLAMMGYLGFLAGPPLVGAFAGSVGLRSAFLLLAALVLFVALLGHLHHRSN